ncbi:hypothetical protein RJ640_003714, partial [Escallonia rubra]
MSTPSFLFINGAVSPAAETPPVTTLLESLPGAYTTTRTHNNASQVLFWERHLRRLANSARILCNSNPKLLFQSDTPRVPNSLQLDDSVVWESITRSLVNDSMRKAMPVVLRERKGDAELAITALVSGNLEKLSGSEDVDLEKISRAFDVYVHVSSYVPLVFGVRGNGARLAVVGRGRDAAESKYSDWVRRRKSLERLRPPLATELLLSSDGDQILEGCLTSFFVVCRKDNIENLSVAEREGSAYSIEIQTAPISDGVLRGVIREVVIDVCSRNKISLREIAPSWSKRDLWVEAFTTNSLRVLQHVETIQVPSKWEMQDSHTWKEVTWEEKQFEKGPGSITAIVQ